MRRLLSLGSLAVAAVVGSSTIQAQQPIPLGVVVPKVECREASGYSYALYLPSSYTPDKKWPAVFCLDPGGNGERPVRLLAAAAEKYGYILLGSNDSRNGPWDPMLRAQNALYREGFARYAINPKRAYAAGFSGGARAALHLALSHPGAFAGVLSCGAFYSSFKEVEKGCPLACYLIAGERDFNLFEMTRAFKELPKKGARCWFTEFAGDHRWPPEPLLTQGIEYFEAEAIKTGLAPENSALFERLARERAASAEEALAAGRATAAWREFLQAAELCKDRADTAALAARATALASDPRVKERLAIEPDLQDLRAATLGGNPLPERVRTLHNLQKTAKRGGEKGAFAEVMVQGGCNSLMEESFASLALGDPKAAIMGADAAVEVCSTDRLILYNTACIHARGNDKRGALKLLRRAVEAGFSDPAYLEKDPDLSPLRQEPEFLQLLSQMKGAGK